MKTTAATFLFIASVLLGCQSASRPETEKHDTPELKGVAKFAIHKDFHNFGILQDGEIVSFSFWIKSTGETQLRITNVETDCGCLEVHFSEQGILPGDSAAVEVVYSSAGDIGKQLKTVSLFTNAEKEQIDLHVAANVNSDWIDLTN